MENPDATFEKIVRALREDNREEAREGLEDLLSWVNRGGFLPHPEGVTRLPEEE